MRVNLACCREGGWRLCPAGLPRELVQPGICLRNVAEAPVGSARSAAVMRDSGGVLAGVEGAPDGTLCIARLVLLAGITW